MKRLDGHHMMVIEDDYLVAARIVDDLVSAGATVAAVASQPEAFNELTTWHFTAAVVDINLGHGPDYTSATKLQRDRIPFVFLTGYHLDQLTHEFMNVPLVAKPHSAEQLVDAVRRAVDLTDA